MRSLIQVLAAAALLCIAAVTGIVLLVAGHYAEKTSREAIERDFNGMSSYETGLEDGRQAAVDEQCLMLARSARIRLALQESDINDLYEQAYVEMPDVFEGRAPGSRPSFLRANFVRFINSEGEVLSPDGSDPGFKLAPWEKALAPFGPGLAQQTGYVSKADHDASPDLKDVISTPVIDADNGQKLGTMVVGFTPAVFDDTEPGQVEGGIVTGGEFYAAPGVAPGRREQIAQAVCPAVTARENAPGSAAAAGGGGRIEGNFQTVIGGAPYLVFYQLLDPGSPLGKAWQVGLYPLAGSIAEQAQLRWAILGTGLLILLLGLGISHLISKRLARPVEEIAADSAANQAARELSEQRFRGIFENAVEGIFILSPELTYASVNPSMARIFGYESAASLIETWNGNGAGAHVDQARQRDFLETVTREGAAAHWEMEMARRDGRRIWISQSARAVRSAEGKLLHIEGTLVDITEHKHGADELQAVNKELACMLETLQATQQQVIQQERLRALGQMASGIAHDFNNALMPISGFSELLLTNPDALRNKEDALEYLGMINTAARDAGTVVGRLREFYRPNQGEDVFGAVMLNRVVKQAVTLTQPKWKDQAQANGAEVAVRVQLDDRQPVTADESALRELLTNLIFNAVDAMPEGGRLNLHTYCEPDCGVIEVVDSGTGMSPEVRQRCLEPFFSTKGERGTGLGLAMVFGIVQRHQGSIDINSAPGKGTRFIIRLPLFQEGAASGESTPNIISSRPLQVLVVDDEPQVREVLAAFLNAEGHVCETAAHALEGIHIFQQRHFDVVIADKAMPGMSGDQMAISIKKIAPSVPFVLLTGFGSFLNGDEMPDVDVIASKPITRSGLREVIGKAFRAA